jgi:hypothetical protein
MKKSVSKRSRNNGLKRIRRKNTRSKRRNTISKRRRYTRTKKYKKNKKLIGGVIGKIRDDTTLTLTYDLNSQPFFPYLRDNVNAELKKYGTISSEIKNLPLDDEDQPSIIVADHIKIEKTGLETKKLVKPGVDNIEEGKEGEFYSVTVVGNFGESKKGNNSKTLRSIKLANVPEDILKKLLIKSLINLSEKDSNKDLELKNKVCEHLLMFFNKFTKSCSNSLEIEILKALDDVKNMTIEALSNHAIIISGKLKKDTSITLFSLIKQFLCLEPIQFKKSGGGLRGFLTPFEFVGCIFFGVFALCFAGKESNNDDKYSPFKLMVKSMELLSEDIRFLK